MSLSYQNIFIINTNKLRNTILKSPQLTYHHSKKIIQICTAVLHVETRGQTDGQTVKTHYFVQIARIIHIKDDISKGETCIKLQMNL